MQTTMPWIIGVDVGGTFTDFYGSDPASGDYVVHKTASTPDNPARAIADGLKEMCTEHRIAAADVVRLGHGTTVGTNTLIQRRGAPIALITTRGFRDLLEIGRQTRPHMFDMQVDNTEPLVPRELRLEVTERVLATGKVLRDMDEADVERAVEEVAKSGVEACAVCFLFSFLNPTHERAVGAALRKARPDLFISLSSEVQPEFREYERLSTTVLNAYLQPVISKYLDYLEKTVGKDLIAGPIGINQSSGGLMSLDRARSYPIRTALSGPAAGVVGAVHVARTAGRPNVVTLDVGGTSADVCLVQDHAAGTAFNRTVADFPVRLPMVDIETIGAGGGSVAWFDRDGLMKVGPISAGASPGPACYGMGGNRATVTDANLILGRLSPAGLIGGRMPLDPTAARRAVEPLAERLGISAERAAHGVISIAISNMVRAIRAVSVERGHDPRGFTLMPFGGAGPLHATDVARSLGIGEILVPPAPGILCAHGLVVSDLKEDFVRTARTVVEESTIDAIGRQLEVLEAEATAWFEREGVTPQDRLLDIALEMRYVGQNFELPVAIDADEFAGGERLFSAARLKELFFAAHETNYGFFNPDDIVEVVNFRLTARGHFGLPEKAPAASPAAKAPSPVSERPINFEPEEAVPTPVYGRDRLVPGHRLRGPAVIEQLDATTLVYPGDRLVVDEGFNMLIEVSS
jgi:N-methylhydantoinase A